MILSLQVFQKSLPKVSDLHLKSPSKYLTYSSPNVYILYYWILVKVLSLVSKLPYSLNPRRSPGLPPVPIFVKYLCVPVSALQTECSVVEHFREREKV